MIARAVVLQAIAFFLVFAMRAGLLVSALVGLLVGVSSGCVELFRRDRQHVARVRALNTALAHLEGRTSVFSTRNRQAVIQQLRDALGTEVNEMRGVIRERDDLAF